MEIKTLENTTITEILDVFNESFSDYIVTFHLSLERLQNMLQCESVALDISVGAFENDKLIGFILHGQDIVKGTKMAYNASTGIIPSKRGYGITEQLYAHIIPILKDKGISRIILEVIIGNDRALHIYEKLGFTVTRKLNCYKGEIGCFDRNQDIKIQSMDEYEWGLMQSCWDFEPAWSNSTTAMEILINNNISMMASIKDVCVGYLIYNPLSKRIQQFGVDKYYRQKGIGKQLFSHLINQIGDNNISIINVESTSTGTVMFLNKIGLNLYIQQYEMVLRLDS